MSLRRDGTYRCDRCDTDVGNAAVTECAIATTLTGGLDHLVLHLCRRPRKGAPHGCAAHVLTAKTLAAYHSKDETP